MNVRVIKSVLYILTRKLGLPKWDKYDPCIKAMVCESYSNQNSMIKVGEMIGDHLFSQFSTAPHREHYRLSRQTVHNILKSTLLYKHLPPSQKQTPQELFIMVDEKYVPLQDKSKSKVMIKSAVIFEGINSANKRNHFSK